MKSIVWLSSVLLLYSCTVEPQPIAYGQDNCAFCKMTIVDTRYAAQIVTSKGKAYKFDAIECMVNYKTQNNLNGDQTSFHLITDYSNPPQLIDATQGFYLRSARLPSPMGMFITGFGTEAEAEKIADEVQGTTYSWEELLRQFDQLPVLTQTRN